MAFVAAEPSTVPPPARVVVPILAVGGAFSFVVLAVPGYVAPSPGARLTVAGIGVACLLAAVACSRFGLTRPLLMLLALTADLATSITFYTLPESVSVTTSPTLFTLPGVVVALYGSRRMVVAQLLAAAAGTAALFSAAGDGSASALTQAISSWLATTGPCVAVWHLRSRLERSVEDERHRSVTDPLTLVGNRRAVDARAAALLRLAAADGVVLGVAVVDVDHFKRINDRHGHRVGDEIILEVSRSLTASVRADDLVVRLGGEEFAVFALLPADDPSSLGERIRTTVAQRCAAHRVTVSVGVTWRDCTGPLPQDPVESLWQLVEEADGLMYTAKRDGRNRVRTGITRQPAAPLTDTPLPA